MGLQLRLYLLLGLMLGILYVVMLIAGSAIGVGGFVIYAALAAGLMFIQYLIGPSMVSRVMKVKYVSEKEQPGLHHMVDELLLVIRAIRVRMPHCELKWEMSAQVLPLTWHHSLSTLKKALFGDYTYEMSCLQQFNDSG